ncbi:serine/threonine-protein phosphatase [Nitrosospira lacus]|uniref:PPM-type phosphatase domain-containing protein n=1 Tax=Nitrosospira lacus TaxID=1288494 RepID=A0A1W6SQD9_9PROT|nr:protein phosphatase 2C domain-containing protein [Nitrosospira lacus]ARO88003.1 serine/threonine-protein phosphatase [Nitrosospira lacus]
MQLEIVALSKAGGREVNEDACGFWSTPEACFCVLSDGLGGHYGGDVASKVAVQHILDWFRKTPECSARAVRASLEAGNSAIMLEQQRDTRLKQMRATAVVLSIDTRRDTAIWGHTGDSRLYCFRQGRIIEQTSDHSVLQSMVDAGYLQPKELRISPNRSKLLAALGNEQQFELNIRSAEFPLLHGDIFLLCTDGLWEYVEEEDMERTLGASASAAEWLRALESQVLARGHERQDNYSAIVVWCSDPDETMRLDSIKNTETILSDETPL